MSEQVDHRAEALRLIDAAFEREASDGEPEAARLLAAEAQVHASLAIAQGQERVAEALEGQVEGRYRLALAEIVGATGCLDEPDDNKVRARCFRIADDALKGARR